MSSLFKLKTPIAEATVKTSDGESFTVRGLNPAKVMAIYDRHAGQMGTLFERVSTSLAEKGQVDAADMQDVVIALFREAPDLMAELIAVASGANPVDDTMATDQDGHPLGITRFDSAVQIAGAQNMAVQLDALQKIGELTFSSDMPPKKFAALVISLCKQATGAMKTAQISPET